MQTKDLFKFHSFGKMLVCSCLLVGLGSCSDDEQTPPQPEPTDEYTLTLKSSETVAFETFAAGSESAQAATGTEAEWFGKRTQLAGASTLYFHDGQVDMTKPGGLKESYDMKWEGDELLLHDGANDSWTRCGKKDKDGKLKVDMVFYRLTRTGERPLAVTGQAYGTPTADELRGATGKDGELTWAKRQYLYE